MTSKQSQKGGDGSVQYQIGTLNVGIDESRAKEIARQVMIENFPLLQQQALDKAYARGQELTDEFIDQALKNKIENFDVLSSPRKQNDLLQAQKGFAFSDANTDLKNVLKQLLISACKDPAEHSLNSITISEAISIVPKMTHNQIRIITSIYAFSNLIFHSLKNFEDFRNLYEDLINKIEFLKIDLDQNQFLHLEYLGCLSIEAFSSNMLSAHYKKEYPGLFSHGYTADELEKELGPLKDLPANAIAQCLHEKDKFQMAYLNEHVLNVLVAKGSISEQLKIKFLKLLTGRSLSDEEIEKILSGLSDLIRDFSSTWAGSLLRRCRLSSVGTLIAHDFLTNKSIKLHDFKV